MNALQVNADTGLLESSSPTGLYTFNSERKSEFLNLARSEAEAGRWPHIPNLCKSVGIAVQTFYNHVNTDEEFRGQWVGIKRILSNAITLDMYEHSKHPKNYMDRVTLQRHLFPAEWGGQDPTTVGNVDIVWLKNLINAVKPAVIATEAEIISTTPKHASNSLLEPARTSPPTKNE